MLKNLLILATVIQISQADTLLRSLSNGDKRAIQQQDTLLRSLKDVVQHDTLLKSLKTPKNAVQHDTLLRNLKTKANVQHDTLLRNLKTKDNVQHDTLLKSLNAVQHDTLLKSLKTPGNAVQHDTLLRNLKTKDNVQHDTLLRDLKIKDIAQHDTLLKSLKDVIQHDTLLKALKTDPKAPKIDFAALHKKFQTGSKKDREEVIKFYREQIAAQKEAEKSLRPKRDIAATVVGAAVSSVVANLMKNVAAHEIPTVVQAPVKQDVQEPQGMILGSGEAPVANEIVPVPFFPVRVPVANDVVPVPVAPIHADVEVIVGGNATSTSTAAPAAVKKGFWATFFESIKLFFGTVTNSVGGFFINIGQTLSDFVEKRITVR